MQDTNQQKSHSFCLENREVLNLTGIIDVSGFDEETVSLQTPCGNLIVKGQALHISRLSLDTGDVSVDGRINSLQYLGDTRQKGLMSKIFK